MTSQIIYFSFPRSGSTMLQRILTEKQSNVTVQPNPFGRARFSQVLWLQQKDYADGMQDSAKAEYEHVMSEDVAKWEQTLDESGNKIVFTNFHAFFPADLTKIVSYLEYATSKQVPRAENFTLVPESLLLRKGTIPVFTIRDPRLSVPSAYRTLAKMDLPHGGGRANFLLTTTLLFNRILYEWYIFHGFQPIVLDADDYMTTNSEFFPKLCKTLDLEPTELNTVWDREDEASHHPMYVASQSTLLGSTGVDCRKAGTGRDLKKEEMMWTEEFGPDVDLVKEMVELAQGDYEFLWERRWKP